MEVIVRSIVIDTLGSDNGPKTIIDGACLALKEHTDIKLVFTGEHEFIENTLKENQADMSRVEIINAPEVITNYDHPAMAIKEKTHSSLVKGLLYLNQEKECVGLINAGSTGALLVGAMVYLRQSAQLQRPALAAILPASKGNFVCVVDTGANVDCTSDMLVMFAKYGRDFMRRMYNIAEPKIGLLSNGVEASKGNALVKETHQRLMAEDNINFVGNFEGTNALSGDCDVLVCDGFDGNQILKATEGCARSLITDIMDYSEKENEPKYKELARKLAAKYDFNSLGGAVVLGVAKPVIKAHGASNEYTIKNTIKMLINLANNDEFYKQEEE